MTSIEEPEIMECAVIITDSDLTTLDKGNWVIHFDQSALDKLGDRHQKTFADRKNGGNNLFADCLKSRLTKDQVENELLTLIQRHCPPKMCSLAGSSIHIDKRVLELQMPKVHDYLHYRIIDVSSFQAIMKRWAPWLERKIKDQVVRNGSDTVNHRAMDDIIWSISYMREMRSCLNKLALIRNPILSASEDAKISVSHRSIVELTKEYKQATRIDSLPSTQPQKQSEEQIQYQNYSYRPFFSRGMEKSTISNQIIHSNTLSAESAACKTKACQVCFDEKPAASFTQRISRQCKHRERNICNTCIYEHIAQAFQKMCSDDVRCPELNCRIILDYEAIKKILQDARNIDLLQRYERFYLEHQLEQMPEFIWCTHACGSGQLAEQGDQNNIIRCVKCRKKSCFIHRVHWHEGLTCAKYDEQIDSGRRATDQWLAQHTKNCPKCRYGIEKTTGCDHMTCTQCHFEFCWACLAAYADIRSDGNHRHYQHCKHFRAYPK
ncbi:hypothetical protein I4U23_001345 [Adineta vaga]|nr:hypothetical protein I4U23_001345 [Adineta vaga]